MCARPGLAAAPRARRHRGRGARSARALRMLVAAALLGAREPTAVWYGLDELLGRAVRRPGAWPCWAAIAAGSASTPPPSGRWGCPRRARSGACSRSRRRQEGLRTPRLTRRRDRWTCRSRARVLRPRRCASRRARVLGTSRGGRTAGLGLECSGARQKMRAHAARGAGRRDAAVEKIAALGGVPTPSVAPLELRARPGGRAVDRLIEGEHEALEALRAAIEPTGERRLRGRRASARAHEHAQAGAGRLRSCARRRPCIARTRRPGARSTRARVEVARATRIALAAASRRPGRGHRERPGACAGRPAVDLDGHADVRPGGVSTSQRADP